MGNRKRKFSAVKDRFQYSLREMRYFVNPKSYDRRKKFCEDIKGKQASHSLSRILISHRVDGAGKGMFYDHWAMHRATDRETSIYLSQKKKRKIYKPHKVLQEYVRSERVPSQTFSYGTKVFENNKFPDISSTLEGENNGLLYIPGEPRRGVSVVDMKERRESEEKAIKDAKKTGRPILAVCAGNWRLWQSYGGRLRKVTDHNYRAGMPSVKVSGKVGKNKPIHSISLPGRAKLLRAAMNFKNESLNPKVNSVHWKAADEAFMPEGVTVSAWSKRYEGIAPKTSKGCVMEPEENTIEAFESNFGAPVLGIQWHPEAYTRGLQEEFLPEQHNNILLYMVKAADTYVRKRKVVEQIKALSQVKVALYTVALRRSKSSKTMELYKNLKESKCLFFYRKYDGLPLSERKPPSKKRPYLPFGYIESYSKLVDSAKAKEMLHTTARFFDYRPFKPSLRSKKSDVTGSKQKRLSN